MTNEEICEAIQAVEKSDIKSLFDRLDNQEKETYKLCFHIIYLHLYFCELPNSEYCSDKDVILCILTKNEILDINNIAIIKSKIEKEFGVCNRDNI